MDNDRLEIKGNREHSMVGTKSKYRTRETDIDMKMRTFVKMKIELTEFELTIH